MFSAWPVASESGTEGYLYVVLGGQKYEQLASNIGDTYAAKSSVTAIAIIALFTAIVGLLVFGLLTRRLKKLNSEMQRITDSHFADAPDLPDSDGGDEIDELSNAFVDMSAQIRKSDHAAHRERPVAS